ncbi:MAG: preprotein translocase subunit YajC [Rhodospirillales bacterium]|nr:preprotein translocase subunit YajC [Rhodospirillales bacterium]
MFVSPAYARAGGATGGGGLEALLPLVLIFVVFYFLLIRPQQKKMKDHKAMLADIRRGDKIVTGGGIMGTISKVDDDHIVTVEIAKDVKVKVRRELVSAVLNKTGPVSAAANDAGVSKSTGIVGMLSGFFGSKQAPAAETAPEAEAEEAPKKAPRAARARKKPAAPEAPASNDGPESAGSSDAPAPANDDK